jgi:RND family efflux transporter MFP subunit
MPATARSTPTVLHPAAAALPMVAPMLAALTLAALLVLASPRPAGAAAPAAAPALQAVAAEPAAAAQSSGFDGVVEAVRQTVVAAQVPGAIVELAVKAGDRVQAGQLLLRIDARAAEQTAAAGDAQVQAARANQEVAAREFERQRQLFHQNYISQAALDRAEATFKASQAESNALIAQAGAARTQSGLHLVRAPFAGVVAELPVALGDMAMPGRPLLTLYDPAALRVTAAVPQSVLARAGAQPQARIELPGLGAGAWLQPAAVQVLPAADAATHTQPLRAALPPLAAGAVPPVPGMFARLWLTLPRAAATGPAAAAALQVPAGAVVRRGELTGVYVLDAAGRPLLRQVRLGRADGDRVEVLTGLARGERVATDPQAAARVR